MAGSGWADHRREDGKRRPLALGSVRWGLTLIDMPAARPAPAPKKIKGLPGPTAAADEDYLPGGGAWYPVTP